MKNVKQILIIWASLLIIAGCGSKKKITQSEKTKVEVTETEETTENKTQVTKEEEYQVKTADSIVEKEEKVITKTEGQELDIEADSTGVVTVTEEKIGNLTRYKYTGVKNVRLSDKTESEEKTTNERLQLKKSDSINKVKSDSINLLKEQLRKSELATTTKTDSKDKEEKGGLGFFFWGFWALLLIIALIIARMLYKYRQRVGFF